MSQQDILSLPPPLVRFFWRILAVVAATEHTHMSDSDLLQNFASKNDQSAFAELVRRHINLVYATGLHLMNGDTHAAEDVVQNVFIDLARKASSLVDHPCLAGWLYACARFTATNTIRRERRRHAREQATDFMHENNEGPENWSKIAPVIDDALQELDERDRAFVLLRFFGQQSFGAIALQFEVSENTVQKAVGRALDLLSTSLARKDIKSTAGALALALAENAVAAPASLVSTVLGSGLGAPMVSSSAVVGALKVATTLVVASGLAMAVGYWNGTARRMGSDIEEAKTHDLRLRAQLLTMNDRLIAERRRTAVAEADTATLLRAIDQARAEREASRKVVVGPAPQVIVPSTHAVQRGDTLRKIATRYGVDEAALTVANPNVDFKRLTVGEELALPPGAVSAVEPATAADLTSMTEYVLKAGDTGVKVARSAGLTLDQLKQANPDINWARLAVGQKIRLR
jgi:RNA polymerase sigma factor (sigma-70 family)